MGERISGAFAAGIGRATGFLPALLSALVIAAIGYLLSRVAGSLLAKLLARLGFDRFAERHLHPAKGLGRGASRSAGAVVFWLGLLVTASLAAEALGLETLSRGLGRVLAYVPRVIVAAVIMVVAVAIGNFVARFLGGTTAKAARAAVIVLGAFMAFDQLGVARSIVVTLFTAVVGAAAVAAAIAFGVGGIPAARDYAGRWSRRVKGGLDQPEPRVSPRTGGEPPEIIPH